MPHQQGYPEGKVTPQKPLKAQFGGRLRRRARRQQARRGVGGAARLRLGTPARGPRPAVGGPGPSIRQPRRRLGSTRGAGVQ